MRRLFIVRKDLNLSPGKLAAQVSHCAELYWLHKIQNERYFNGDNYNCDLIIDKDEMNEYICGPITKTVLQARNLMQLLKAGKLAEELGLKEGYDFGFVNDLCLTELEPENEDGTCTTAFWTKPLEDEIAHKISKKYHLYMGESEI